MTTEAAAANLSTALAELDLRTDTEFWGPCARFTPMMALHQRAETDLGDEHQLTKALFWETALFNTGLTGNRRPGSSEPRFAGLHSGLTQPEALDLLAPRMQSRSAVVRSRVGDLLWEYGDKQRRRAAVGAPAAMLEIVRKLGSVPDELEDLARTFVAEDCMERCAELALAMNRVALVEELIGVVLATLKGGIDDRRWQTIMCTIPALSLLGRHLTPERRAEATAFVVSAIPVVEAHPPTAAPYIIGRLYELRRELALAAGDGALAAVVDVEQAEVWVRHAEEQARPTAGLAAARLLGGALELLERAGDRTSRVNELKLRRRQLTQVGIRNEMRRTSFSFELDPELVAWLDAAAAQAVDALFATLANASILRVTEATSAAAHREAERLAPLSTMMPAHLLRSDAAAVPLTSAVNPHAREARDLMTTTGWLLRAILDRVRRRHDITPATLIEQLRASGNFREENLAVISVGLDRAWSDDPVSALHVLVPQLEDVLRALLPRIGVDTMVPGREPGATQEITLGQILPRLREHEVMTEDDRFLFSLILERAAGDNLRHDVAHGLIRVPLCTDERVARILQLYAIVGSWRLPTQAVDQQ